MKNLNTHLFFGVLTLALQSHASEVFKSFAEDRFESQISVDYFKTEANYSSEGTSSGLPSGNSYQITDIHILGRYVPLIDFGIYAGLNIGNSQSINTVATRKNSTLNNITFGADYLLYKADAFSTYGDLSYDFALEKVKSDTDSVLNNDGAGQLKVGLTSIFDFGGIVPFAQLGLNYRTQGLSTLLTYGGGIEFRFENSLTLGGALNGYLTIKEDSNTNQAFERDNITLRVNGGSKRFYGINPNNLDSDIYLKYSYDQDLSFKFGGGTTLLGSNSAQGYHLGAAVVWGIGGRRVRYSRPVRRENPVIQPRQQTPHFQEDTNDGVNQDYFKPVKPSKEEYVKPVDEDLKIETKALPRNSTPPVNDKEYQIKLKKLKKKNRP
ncbi:MAG: hypothetical protein H7328_13165 [Bdellovibrio sp.]|nr:hypothetical protein [Bdellovibrio sp.]